MNERRAKFSNLLILWFLRLVGATIIIKFILLQEYDLVLNALGWAYVWYQVSNLIKTPWFKSIPRVRKMGAIAVSVSFALSAFLSSDWNETRGLANLYFGPVHIHHVEWSLFLLLLRTAEIKVVLLPGVFEDKEKEAERKRKLYRRYSKQEFFVGIGVLILFLLAFFEKDIFPNSLSFRLVSGFLAAVSLFMSWYLRSSAVESEGFKRVMGAFYAVLLGIFLEGALGYLINWPASSKHI